MRCPRCDRVPMEPTPACENCGFRIADAVSALTGAPERDGAIVDAAGVLSQTGQDRLASRLWAFTHDTGHDAVVVTIPSTVSMGTAEYAVGLFEQWRVGGQARDGLMVMLAIAEQRIECVLGPALTPALPDDAASALLASQSVPHLSRGEYDHGLFHGLDMLARVFEHVEGLR